MSTLHQGATAIPKNPHTVFACQADPATAGFLAGSFDDWRPTATPMTRDNRGIGPCHDRVLPGRDTYTFVVDSEWYCEPGRIDKNVHCPHGTIDEWGTMNRVLGI
ncbi:MAG TPA: glycogen-binding domain-containing protein [Candidatus Tectomicrobia bacterium]